MGTTKRAVLSLATYLTCAVLNVPAYAVDNLESIPYTTKGATMGGYKFEEASQFIEFCVDLDSQDDRLNPALNQDELRPQIDPSRWTVVYDSRAEVAKDLAYFHANPAGEESDFWRKLYLELSRDNDRLNKESSTRWDADAIYRDPRINGFGPWQNAWVLYAGHGLHAGDFAIAIRGTVFASRPSAVENARFHSVRSDAFLSNNFRYSSAADAAVHSGFAHATFTLLLDERYGILQHIQKIPRSSRLFVIGHSQGAAMATLVQSFLRYASDSAYSGTADPFGLNASDFKLKSYGFAQPKPGNYAFSADFSRHTQNDDSAIVINNDIDPVPKVPLTLEATGDIQGDFGGTSIPSRVIRYVSSIGASVRLAIAAAAEPFVIKSATGYGHFFAYDRLKPLGEDKSAATWNFWPAGRVIFVYGLPGDGSDLFLQHHAVTYRKLIADQLNH